VQSLAGLFIVRHKVHIYRPGLTCVFLMVPDRYKTSARM
jgi:hypothetical protein